MKDRLRGGVAVAAAGLLSGCGVPTLYAPPQAASGTGSVQLAPKVTDVIDEIACELVRVHKAGGFQGSFLISVLLTLQVEDNLDLTPSLTFIHPLADAGTSRSALLAGDLGGGRKRNFTTNYFLESEQLASKTCPNVDKPPRKKLYQLSGDLGLADIVRDGQGLYAYQYPILHHPKKAEDKAVTTFGSTIQFTVTKAITALGPLWTLKKFKGPSGNNGLFNTKRLNTDSVTITFARKPPEVQTAAQQAAQVQMDKAERNRTAAELVLTRENARLVASRAALATARFQATQPGIKGVLLAQTRQRLKQAEDAAAAAETAATRATETLDSARDAARGAEADLAEANAAASERSSATATEASQALLTTMVLQNLNLQPR